jgi:hypothetical protein
MFKIIRACVFVLLLACATQAGEMQNGAPQPPPPAPSTATAQEEAMTMAVMEEEGEGDLSNSVSDTLTEAALSVLGNVLALL